jgi:hypothetical protein
MNPSAYALLGLTAIIGALVAILAFAMMRFAATARDARRNLRERRVESALRSAERPYRSTFVRLSDRKKRAQRAHARSQFLPLTNSMPATIDVAAR